jgi:hypothetical protein
MASVDIALAMVWPHSDSARTDKQTVVNFGVKVDIAFLSTLYNNDLGLARILQGDKINKCAMGDPSCTNF